MDAYYSDCSFLVPWLTMACTEFDSLKPLKPFGDELVKYANAAFSADDDKLFGVQIRLWLEAAVLGFLDSHHNLPPVTGPDLDASTKKRRPGESEFRIDRAVLEANAGAYLNQAMHRVRVYGNKSNHSTPEYIASTKKHAREIRDWLLNEYVPQYSGSGTTPKSVSAAQNYPTKNSSEGSRYDPFTYDSPSPAAQPPLSSRPIPTPRRPKYPRLSDRSPITENFYKHEPPSRFSTFWSSNLFAWLVVFVVATPIVWFSYRVVVAIGDLWTKLPTLSQVATIAVPSNPWTNDPKPSSPVVKAPATIAERMQLPPQAEVSRLPPQAPSPQVAPAPSPPIVQLGCPPGTLYDSYTSQCTFLAPADQTDGSNPPLSIHPDCPSGLTYSDQSQSCVIIEATNECPSGTYLPEGSLRCISKLKYPFFRYGETRTLLTNVFVQAPPVQESYVVRVLAGSLRVFYAEDPASARNVVLSNRTQHLYNYAIISCVICPATFVTNRLN